MFLRGTKIKPLSVHPMPSPLELNLYELYIYIYIYHIRKTIESFTTKEAPILPVIEEEKEKKFFCRY